MRAPAYSDEPEELFGTEAIEHPERLYTRLRERHPISRIGDTGVHLVATWDLIEDALGREADFSANLTGVLMRAADGLPTIFELPDNSLSRVIATADEPEHGVHRALTQPRLTATRIATLEDPIRGWAGAEIDRWLGDGGGEFVPVSELIPARVVSTVLGLPDGDVSKHRKWAMMGGDFLAGDVDHSRMAHLAAENINMGRYLGEHVEQARKTTRQEVDAPLLHALARGIHEQKIGPAEALGIAAVMFGAGGESTAALIGSVVRRLAAAPELALALRRDANLIPRFIEEVARLEPPFKFHYRAVRRACELGGASLEQGDRLMLVWASANRDAGHFELPDELRLDRRHPKRHLSFGRGAHFCIGAPLARLEARVVCEELLARTRSIGLRSNAAPKHTRSIFVRRLESLPLEAQPLQ